MIFFLRAALSLAEYKASKDERMEEMNYRYTPAKETSTLAKVCQFGVVVGFCIFSAWVMTL